jgi:mycothiol synthase
MAATRPRAPGGLGLPADVRARPYDPAGDLPAAVRLIWEVSGADGHDWFPSSEQLATLWRRAPGFDPVSDILVAEDAGGMAGIVAVDRQKRSGKVIHWIEGWVRPDRRRQGIGSALVRWAEGHAAAVAARGGTGNDDLPQFLGFGAMETDGGAHAIADALGYTRTRYGFHMRRPLAEPIPDAPLPPGIEVRPVRPEDHRKIFDADVEAFLDHFEPRTRTEDDFTYLFTAPNVDTSMWCVAWDGDEVVGSVMNQINPDENARIGLAIGWLEHVSVRREWRGRGVAKALIAASLRLLRDRGMDIAALGVDAENPTGALGLYERLGFGRHETWITYRKPLP